MRGCRLALKTVQGEAEKEVAEAQLAAAVEANMLQCARIAMKDSLERSERLCRRWRSRNLQRTVWLRAVCTCVRTVQPDQLVQSRGAERGDRRSVPVEGDVCAHRRVVPHLALEIAHHTLEIVLPRGVTNTSKHTIMHEALGRDVCGVRVACVSLQGCAPSGGGAIEEERKGGGQDALRAHAQVAQ
eukprot:5741986-Pleurochrysis_carterae.AAC.1